MSFDVSRLDLTTGDGQEQALSLMLEMLREINRLQSDLSKSSELGSENASLRSALSDAQKQLEEDRASIKTAEETIIVLQSQVEEMRKQMREYTAASSALSEGQQSLSDASFAVAEAEKRIRSLSSENAQLQRQLLTSQQSMRAAATVLSELSSTNARLLKALEEEIGPVALFDEERSEWDRIRKERAWIERFWARFDGVLPAAGV